MKGSTPLLFSTSLLAFFAVGAFAKPRTCGNTEVPSALLEEARQFGRVAASIKGSAVDDDFAQRTLVVRTYFHNIYIERNEAGGYLSREQLQKQVGILSITLPARG